MKYLFSALALVVLLFSLAPNTQAAYTELNCSSNPEFTANSCNQCFDGGSVTQGDNKGLLTDLWENVGTKAQVLFKEEQKMPVMQGLGGATWTEIKASDDVTFWNYTEALDALYDEDASGYVLQAGESEIWLESSLGSAYQFSTNPVEAGKPAGLLMYDIVTHDMDADGVPSLEKVTHRECVLFTSATGTPVTPTTPAPPKELPQTGAEHVFLVFVALLLGLGFMKFRKRA